MKDFDVDQIRTENLIFGMLLNHGMHNYVDKFEVDKKKRRCIVTIKVAGKSGKNNCPRFSLPYDGQTLREIDALHDKMEAVAKRIKKNEYGGIS